MGLQRDVGDPSQRCRGSVGSPIGGQGALRKRKLLSRHFCFFVSLAYCCVSLFPSFRSRQNAWFFSAYVELEFCSVVLCFLENGSPGSRLRPILKNAQARGSWSRRQRKRKTSWRSTTAGARRVQLQLPSAHFLSSQTLNFLGLDHFSGTYKVWTCFCAIHSASESGVGQAIAVFGVWFEGRNGVPLHGPLPIQAPEEISPTSFPRS